MKSRFDLFPALFKNARAADALLFVAVDEAAPYDEPGPPVSVEFDENSLFALPAFCMVLVSLRERWPFDRVPSLVLSAFALVLKPEASLVRASYINIPILALKEV